MHFMSAEEVCGWPVAQTLHFCPTKFVNSGEPYSWREICAAVILLPMKLRFLVKNSTTVVNTHLFQARECKVPLSAQKDRQALPMLKKSRPLGMIDQPHTCPTEMFG
jgi:hypothetical protein